MVENFWPVSFVDEPCRPRILREEVSFVTDLSRCYTCTEVNMRHVLSVVVEPGIIIDPVVYVARWAQCPARWGHDYDQYLTFFYVLEHKLLVIGTSQVEACDKVEVLAGLEVSSNCQL